MLKKTARAPAATFSELAMAPASCQAPRRGRLRVAAAQRGPPAPKGVRAAPPVAAGRVVFEAQQRRRGLGVELVRQCVERVGRVPLDVRSVRAGRLGEAARAGPRA